MSVHLPQPVPTHLHLDHERRLPAYLSCMLGDGSPQSFNERRTDLCPATTGTVHKTGNDTLKREGLTQALLDSVKLFRVPLNPGVTHLWRQRCDDRLSWLA